MSVRRTIMLLAMCLLSVGCVVSDLLPSPTPHPHYEELRAAYEHYEATVREAELNLDTSRLSEVATGEELKGLITGIEVSKDNCARINELVYTDVEILSVEVEEYNPSQATIKVKQFEKRIAQNCQTGARIENPYTAKFCRVYRLTLVKEEGVWKLAGGKQLDFWVVPESGK